MKHISILCCLLISLFSCTQNPLPEPDHVVDPPLNTEPITPTVTLSGEYVLENGTPLKTLTLAGKALAKEIEVKGVLTWRAPETIYAEAGEFDAKWLFTPADTKSYNSVEGTQKITVKLNWIAVEKVTLNQTTLSLAIGAKETLTAELLPQNASDKTITWSSSDEQIAKVDPTGVVSAIAAGQAVITARAVGNQMASCTLTVPKPVAPAPKVYIIGNSDTGPGTSKALFWIDNVLQPLEKSSLSIATSIFVSGNDTYITGQIWEAGNNNPISVYWKNGKVVSLTDQGNNPVPTSIFVSGSDVYVAGYDRYIGENTAGYWLNGKFTIFQNALTEARSIYVYDGDIYMVGRNTQKRTALLWKNGVETTIAGMENAIAVQVSQGHLYAAGYGNNAALYTDGVVKMLFSGSTYANSMFVSGTDVYICGANLANNLLKGWYWHNDTASDLRDGNKSVNVNSIYVANKKVYVVGDSFVERTDNSVARLWIDGVMQPPLPSGEVAGTSAIGVVVQ